MPVPGKQNTRRARRHRVGLFASHEPFNHEPFNHDPSDHTTRPTTRGSMTDVDLEFARVRQVLDRPTLRLMSRPTSAAVVSVFRTVFDRDVQYVPADRMHLQVEEHVARLQATGARVPAGDSPQRGPAGGRGTASQRSVALPRVGGGTVARPLELPPTETSSTA
ncbi:DUF3375 family protein [Curtobacterium sp. MCPF17_052]|uniref:DUF3375 family protein n=1 Tax=Curtobacterium sp. MCPF17_052 TaxID=2175655 RepID=UPI0024DF7FA3|nr:DUF3375 family protein [Curtobacterium sp. MCPF17_052]WIB12639.1 DUF3375 family protein [Curtobacterium sp. MCPF17_052]